jgi:hypothetical protein
VPRATEGRLGQRLLEVGQGLRLEAAQARGRGRSDPGGLRRRERLAALPHPIRITSIGESAADARVRHDEGHVPPQGHGLESVGVEVDAQGVALTAQGARRHVEEAARDADDLVLTALHRPSQLEGRHSDPARRLEGQRHGHAESGGARQPGTDRDRARNGEVHATQLLAPAKAMGRPLHVVEPTARALDAIDIEFPRLVEIRGPHTHPEVRTRAEHDQRVEVDRARQGQPAVVVRVLTDQVDTARSPAHIVGIATEVVPEGTG